MQRSLLDTSALSDVMRPAAHRSEIVARHAQRYLRAYKRFTFSEITCYEILRGLRKKNALAQETRFKEFCEHAELVTLDSTIIDLAATLWARGQQIGAAVSDGDLFIAATAVANGLSLITANTKHFAWISELSIHNWRVD